MKKVWIICTVAVSIAIGFALPAMAEDQNVAGTWIGTVTGFTTNLSKTITDEFTLVLKQDGQAVTGSWDRKRGGTGKRGGTMSENIPVNGTLAGDKLSLTIGETRWFEVTVDGDSMSGKTATGSDRPFSVLAKKTK